MLIILFLLSNIVKSADYAIYDLYKDCNQQITDQSTNGNHAVNGSSSINNEFDTECTKIGSRFNGVNDRITLPSNNIQGTGIALGDSFTIVLIIAVQSPGQIFKRYSSGTTYQLLECFDDSGTFKLRATWNIGGTVLTETQAITLNQWSQVLIRVKRAGNTTVRLKLDALANNESTTANTYTETGTITTIIGGTTFKGFVSNFFFDDTTAYSYAGYNGQCDVCAISCTAPCALCSAGTTSDCFTCTTVDRQVLEPPNSCTCATGYYTTDNHSTCVSCASNCVSCYYNTSQATVLCDQCDTGFYKNGPNSCTASCATNFWENPSGNVCSPCVEPCLDCTDLTTCVTCRDSIATQSGGACSCPAPYVAEDTGILTCVCPDNAQLGGPNCVCKVSFEQNNTGGGNFTCDCPTYSHLDSSLQKCVCDSSFVDTSGGSGAVNCQCPTHSSVFNGACVCDASFINTTGDPANLDCQCPTFANNLANANVCVCDGTFENSTGDASNLNCQCPSYSHENGGACVCDSTFTKNSTDPAPIVCQCAADSEVDNGQCVCNGSYVPSNADPLVCGCPTNSVEVDNECLCKTTFVNNTGNPSNLDCKCPQWANNGANVNVCVCDDTFVDNGSGGVLQCQCPANSELNGAACQCKSTFINNGTATVLDCICPANSSINQSGLCECDPSFIDIDADPNVLNCTCPQYSSNNSGVCQCNATFTNTTGDPYNLNCQCPTNSTLSAPTCSCNVTFISSSDSKGALCVCAANSHLNVNVCQCDTEYYPNPDPTSCANCIPNCDICNNAVTCTQCSPGYYLQLDGTCSQICLIGLYPTTTAPLSCLQCNNVCKSCIGPSSSECMSCSDPNAYVPSPPGSCICKETFTSSPCTCPPNSSIVNKTCQCNPGYVNTNNSHTIIDCTPCPPGCQVCSWIAGVVSCLEVTCTAGFWPMSEYWCEPCSQPCSSCINKSTCTGCIDPLAHVYNGKCVCNAGFVDYGTAPVVDCGCPENSEIKGNGCKCSFGYVNVQPEVENLKCSVCPEECKNGCYFDTDTSLVNCRCPVGTYLWPNTNECRETCPEGGWKNTDWMTCESCEDPCETCLDADELTCGSCNDGLRESVLGKCMCKYPFTEKLGACVCPENSKYDGFTCICTPGFYLINGKTQFCAACPEKCGECQIVGTQIKCTDCAKGYKYNTQTMECTYPPVSDLFLTINSIQAHKIHITISDLWFTPSRSNLRVKLDETILTSWSLQPGWNRRLQEESGNQYTIAFPDSISLKQGQISVFLLLDAINETLMQSSSYSEIGLQEDEDDSFD